MPTVLMLVTKAVNPDPRVEREAHALVTAGLGVRVVGISDKNGQFESYDDPRGFIIHRLPDPCRLSRGMFPGWFGMFLLIIRYYFEVTRRLAMLTADVCVVHCHDFDTLPLGYFLSRMTGAKLVYDSHEAFSGMFSSSVPRWVRYLVDIIEIMLARRTAVITVGRLLAKRFRRMTGRQAVVIRNTPSEWPTIDAINEINWFTVGYVGGLLHDRCIIELVRGFELFHRNHPESELRIAGYGPMAKKLQELIRSSPARIEFIGKIPYSSVASFLSQLSISIILFSRHTENNYYSSPNKLFESLFVGTPVLASNFGELSWLVEKHNLGFVVDPDDPVEIARALISIYDQRERLPELGRKGQDTIRRHFSWEQSRRDFLKTYANLLNVKADKAGSGR